MNAKYAAQRPRAANVFDAFRLAVLAQDVPELAGRMGTTPGTLYNKAEANDESHNKPTLRDVVLLTEITGDMRVIEALADTFGHALFDVSGDTTTDEELLTLLADMGAEHGEFHRALATGLRARRFTPDAYRAIRSAALDTVAALMTLTHRLQFYVDEVPAAKPGRKAAAERAGLRSGLQQGARRG